MLEEDPNYTRGRSSVNADFLSPASRAKHPVGYVLGGIVTSLVVGIVILFLVYFVALGSTEPEDWSARWKAIAVFVYLLCSLGLAIAPHQKMWFTFALERNITHYVSRAGVFKLIYDALCIVSFTRKKVSDALFLSLAILMLCVQIFSSLFYKYRVDISREN